MRSMYSARKALISCAGTLGVSCASCIAKIAAISAGLIEAMISRSASFRQGNFRHTASNNGNLASPLMWAAYASTSSCRERVGSCSPTPTSSMSISSSPSLLTLVCLASDGVASGVEPASRNRPDPSANVGEDVPSLSPPCQTGCLCPFVSFTAMVSAFTAAPPTPVSRRSTCSRGR